MEITREKLLEILRSEMDRNSLSMKELSIKAGLSQDTIRDFFRRKTYILRADKLQKVARVLGLNFQDFPGDT